MGDELGAERGPWIVTRNPCLPSFGRAKLLGSPWALLPKVTGDCESVHAHGHSFGRDGGELFPIRAVLVNGLDHLGDDDPGADAGEPHHLLRLRVHGVNGSELAAGVSEEDEEVVGRALLHFLHEEEEGKSALAAARTGGPTLLDSGTVTQLTSTILFFWGSLTLPARQQRVIALWMINLLDLKLGSLYSFGPVEHATSIACQDRV